MFHHRKCYMRGPLPDDMSSTVAQSACLSVIFLAKLSCRCYCSVNVIAPFVSQISPRVGRPVVVVVAAAASTHSGMHMVNYLIRRDYGTLTY